MAEPFYAQDGITLYHGDCRDVLPELEGFSSVVSDPPYGIGFMGKEWDHGVPGPEFWRLIAAACLPGAPLLAFGGTRTYHRLVCAIEDAGWQIRDCLMWLYGSGFPKSLDISKAIDKNNGEIGRMLKFTKWMRSTGLTAKEINDATGTFMGSHYLTDKSQPAIPTRKLFEKIRALLVELNLRDVLRIDVPAWVDELIDRVEAEREVLSTKHDGGNRSIAILGTETKDYDITAPATDAAKQWDGWGTALKPAYEPICLAMKPLPGTFADNALEHGVAGLWIDGARVGQGTTRNNRARSHFADIGGKQELGEPYATGSDKGRWPANIIHDGSPEVLGVFPETISAVRVSEDKDRQGSTWALGRKGTQPRGHNDAGSAARFFYCAKPSQAERGAGNDHPTVKPLTLLTYLLRLSQTPTGGVVLDPFAGSGSTLVAAKRLGRDAVGIELEERACEVAAERLRAERQGVLRL